MKICFVTSYYRGERYLWRFLACVARLTPALRAAGHEPVFGVTVNAALSRERKRWDAAAKRLPLDLIYCKRESVYASWNRVLEKHGKADAFLVLNMDDWRWGPGTLEQVRLLAETTAARVVVSRHHALQWSLWPLYFRWHPRRKEDLHSPTPFLAWNRAALEKVGLFFEEFRISGDKEWYYRAQAMGVPVILSDVFAGVLYHAGAGLSTSADPRRICENLIIQEIYPDLNSLHYGYYHALREVVAPKIRERLKRDV